MYAYLIYLQVIYQWRKEKVYMMLADTKQVLGDKYNQT